MAYKVGLKLIKRLCDEQKPLDWHKAKLSKDLFKGVDEQAVFQWTQQHVDKHHAVPHTDTLIAAFPECGQFDAPEPVSYYMELVERRFSLELINQANLTSQALLKEDDTKVDAALTILKNCTDRISQQRYRTRILNVTTEAPSLVLQAYNKVNAVEGKIVFGWPYMDDISGGALPGDVISFVGRPASGKTFMGLKSAIVNWRNGRTILFVSMEMNPLAIAQRITAMYAQTSLAQLKTQGFSTPSYKHFTDSMLTMTQEKGNIYVVNGNLAATPEDIFVLARQMQVDAVYIDGAYLMKHKDPRLNRFVKVAENAEAIKNLTEDAAIPTFASWQFSREAAKKAKKGEADLIGLEDIGLSDAIPQTSSTVLGLFQEESVETINSRIIDVMKGRSGEVGRFKINWDFNHMDFDEIEESKVDLSEV